MARAENCIENSMGVGGTVYTASTSQQTGPFVAIEFVTSGAFSELTMAGGATGMTGVTFPQGFRLVGLISTFTLSSGSVVAYKGQVA